MSLRAQAYGEKAFTANASSESDDALAAKSCSVYLANLLSKNTHLTAMLLINFINTYIFIFMAKQTISHIKTPCH